MLKLVICTPQKTTTFRDREKASEKTKAKMTKLNLSKAIRARHYPREQFCTFRNCRGKLMCAFNWVKSLLRKGAHSRHSINAE